ncbi:MAG: hypothetical protein ACYCX4_18460 [Bacillota bacterium]
MAPEWLIQLLWFIASSFAAGAFFYYLGKKDKRKAGHCFIVAIIIALINVFLMVRNDSIKGISKGYSSPLSIRYHTSLLLKYPGPLVYVYKSGLGELIAPIGYAVVVEVTNNRSTPTRISSYYLDAGIGGEWVRLPNLNIMNPMDVFWVNHSDLRNCSRLDFRQNGFDIKARSNSIPPGESLKGWMFFEWPLELRREIPIINKIRINIENIQGEKVSSIMETSNIQDPGISSLGGGELVVLPKTENADLSKLKIMPFIDLLKGFKDGNKK